MRSPFAAEVQRHATHVKWYAEALIEENHWMPLPDALEHALASYGWIGVLPSVKDAVYQCVRGIGWSDISRRTKIKQTQDLRPYAVNLWQRLCVWLIPYT